MAISPIITTPRLQVVPFTERHLTNDYVAWLNDRELMRFSEQRHRTHTLESCRAYWLSFNDTPNYFWAIEATAGGLGHIGNLNAYVDGRNLVADLGILVGVATARSRGYGLEAWRGVCDYLFGELTIRKITAGTLHVNHPMLRLAWAAGMREDGIRRGQCLDNGQPIDIVHFALFREDWEKMPKTR